VRHLSAEHLAALIATAAAAAAAVWAGRRGDAMRTARVLALVIAAGYVTEGVAYALRGEWTPRVNLPLHLTDVVTLAAVAALWRPRPLLVDLVVVWAFTASLAAVLTPDLDEDLPALFDVTFFVTHGGAIAAACLLLARGLVPRPGAALRVYAATAVVAVVAAVANLLTGGNYLFLRRPPASDSPLDLMGPWPWYIGASAVLALALFVLVEALVSRARAAPSGTRRPTTVR
jgi:hypothetical integral membrane protein (TIGR02206 family)